MRCAHTFQEPVALAQISLAKELKLPLFMVCYEIDRLFSTQFPYPRDPLLFAALPRCINTVFRSDKVHHDNIINIPSISSSFLFFEHTVIVPLSSSVTLP